MLGKVSEEREMKVAASEAWKVYGTLQLPQLALKALPHVFAKIDIVQGDGGVGTILHISFQPGIAGPLGSYNEKYTVVDNENRVKVVEVMEGGYLDLGFTLYRVTVEVLEKEEKEDECITRITVEYELKEEAAANVSFVSVKHIVAVMQVVADYLHDSDEKKSDQ